jgi:hypothetical protein
MSEVKHFCLTFSETVNRDGQPCLCTEKSRVAVVFDGGMIRMKHLAGIAPYAYQAVWAKLLLDFFPDDLARMGGHRKERVNPFAIQRRVGMSGCVDYTLRYLVDPTFADWRKGGRLHISMHGKLNEGFSMWEGDFMELGKHLPPVPEGVTFDIEEVSPFDPGDYFAFPGDERDLIPAVGDRLFVPSPDAHPGWYGLV